MTSFNAIPAFSNPSCGRSDDARVMLNFQRLVDEQAALSSDQLHGLHKQWLGPQGLFATFSAEVDRLGRQAPALEDQPRLDDPARQQAVERAVTFVLAQSNRRGAVDNPFNGRSRADLCCVVFDESGANTLVERYAAYAAMCQSHSDFFIKLIATTRGVVERRIVFKGLLEHFDRLLPVEKCIYPEGYRDVQQAHLDREEARYGPLLLSDSVLSLLETMSPLDLLEQIQEPFDSLQ